MCCWFSFERVFLWEPMYMVEDLVLSEKVRSTGHGHFLKGLNTIEAINISSAVLMISVIKH